jgi:hypothetical protein
MGQGSDQRGRLRIQFDRRGERFSVSTTSTLEGGKTDIDAPLSEITTNTILPATSLTLTLPMTVKLR